MTEHYKTLIFTDDKIGKYAHPVEIGLRKFEWGACEIPLLMTMKTTIKDLEELYTDLNFKSVNLVIRKLTEIETNSA